VVFLLILAALAIQIALEEILHPGRKSASLVLAGWLRAGVGIACILLGRVFAHAQGRLWSRDDAFWFLPLEVRGSGRIAVGPMLVTGTIR
jgi:hypothetical protein